MTVHVRPWYMCHWAAGETFESGHLEDFLHLAVLGVKLGMRLKHS